MSTHQFKQIEDGILIGPQPTAEDLDAARARGVKTVIDLRLPQETAAAPNRTLAESHGLAYRNVPVDKERLESGRIDELEAALEASDAPVLVHCATGARVALLLGLSKARKQHWNSEQMFDWARGAGYDLEAQPVFADFVRGTLKKPEAGAPT